MSAKEGSDQVDFRFSRVKLKPEEFALSEGREVGPTDLISKKCWSGLTSLPDDVSLRTSDHYGSQLQLLYDLWGEWICVAYALQQTSNDSAIAYTAGDAVDYFQGAIHNALMGYYRLGFTSLRAVVENMTIGMLFHMETAQSQFNDWLKGEEFGFGRAADRLLQQPRVHDLEQKLRAAIADDLYRQRTPNDAGGFARRLFREASKYAHGTPAYNDADMWKSNGPVFAHKAFEKWAESFFAVYCLALLESRLADQKLLKLGFDSQFTPRTLFHRVVDQLSPASNAHHVFNAVPNDIW
jgi:hypothetical protein